MSSNTPANQASSASYSQPRANRKNRTAIAALITSFFVGLAGVVLGHIALNQLKTSGEGGRGLAIGALVVGYASIALGLIYLVMTVGVTASNH